MMSDGRIHIPARRMSYNQQGVIKITPEAYKMLADVVNESGQSVRAVASEIIVQAIKNNLIVYERGDDLSQE